MIGAKTLAINVIQMAHDFEQGSDLREQIVIDSMIEEPVFLLEYAVHSFHGPPDFRYESRLVGLSSCQLRITSSADGHADNVPFALQVLLHVPESSIHEAIVASLQKVTETICERSLHDLCIIQGCDGRR